MQYDHEPTEYARKLKDWNMARQRALGWMLLTLGGHARAEVREFEN